MDRDNQPIIDLTKKWIERIVIGHNFCPFAAKPFKLKKIAYKVFTQTDTEKIILSFNDELSWMNKHPDIETSLLIFSDGLIDFQDYLDVLDICNNLIVSFGYEGDYQLASFHPQYQFAGTTPDDITNFTNRSPYPIIQILRESSITAALEHYENPEEIPERNMEKAREIGKEGFEYPISNT